MTCPLAAPDRVLARLRVDRTGFGDVRAARLGARFVGDVANPGTVLHVARAAAAGGGGRARAAAPAPRPIEDGELDAVQIEDLVQGHLDADESKLQVLPEDKMNRALEDFVRKAEGGAFAELVEQELARTQKALARAGGPFADEAAVRDAARGAAPRGRGGGGAAAAADDGGGAPGEPPARAAPPRRARGAPAPPAAADEDEDGGEEDEDEDEAAAEAPPKKRARAAPPRRARGARAASYVVDDDDDDDDDDDNDDDGEDEDEYDDGDDDESPPAAPPPKRRGVAKRAPAKKKAKAPVKRKAAPTARSLPWGSDAGKGSAKDAPIDVDMEGWE